MSNPKKEAKFLAKLRLKQHRRLSETGYEIAPVGQIRRVPEIRRALRTELALRHAAEQALSEEARDYLRARRRKAERAEAAGVLRAIAVNGGQNGRASFERCNEMLGDVEQVPQNSNAIDNGVELYAALVAAADWVADWSASAGGLLD